MDNLPGIQIKELDDVTYSNVELHVPDDTYANIVNIGKKEATDSDYFRVGFMSILTENFDKDDKRAE
jgi:hypothetical protein